MIWRWPGAELQVLQLHVVCEREARGSRSGIQQGLPDRCSGKVSTTIWRLLPSNVCVVVVVMSWWSKKPFAHVFFSTLSPTNPLLSSTSPSHRPTCRWTSCATSPSTSPSSWWCPRRPPTPPGRRPLSTRTSTRTPRPPGTPTSTCMGRWVLDARDAVTSGLPPLKVKPLCGETWRYFAAELRQTKSMADKELRGDKRQTQSPFKNMLAHLLISSECLSVNHCLCLCMMFLPQITGIHTNIANWYVVCEVFYSALIHLLSLPKWLWVRKQEGGFTFTSRKVKDEHLSQYFYTFRGKEKKKGVNVI